MINKIILCAMVGIFLSMSACNSPASKSPSPEVIPTDGNTTVRVLWTISQYVMGPNATWDKLKAEAMLFKPLDIEESSIIFDGKSCQNIKFNPAMISTADYLKTTYKITPQELNLSDQEIQVVKTNCELPGFQEYIRLNDRRLIISISGVFFFFEPNVNY